LATEAGGAIGQDDPVARLRAVIGRLSRRLRPTEAGSALTPSQISVLFTVVRAGPIGMSALARIESLNPTMLSRIAAQLIDAGLIVRSVDPGDRRSAQVAATAAGRRVRERVRRERNRALSEQVAQLEDEQREALWAALPALEELVEALPAPRP
jgi:DNA-binding MarR family transcriptional regulator